VNYLLTLDLASRIGWSCGDPTDQQFAYGSHQLPKTGEDIGEFLRQFRNWLQQALDGVSMCVFEQPILPSKTSLITVRKLHGQAGLTELVCLDRKVRCLEQNLQNVKTFMGVSRARGVDQKAEMVRCVERYGYEPENDDAADAIALRLFVLHQMFPDVAKRLPLALGPLDAAAANG
jgi:Holliday junction resolvasome RuvABC endonuclease subunit